MSTALHCNDLAHTYTPGSPESWILRDIELSIGKGECAVLCGPSGSGKTTLLSIAGCLLTPTRGKVEIGGEAVSPDPKQLSRLRRHQIGFVFQHAQLLPFLTVRENLEIVASNVGLERKVAGKRIDDLLERLEMAEHDRKKASVLSGGQRQRVAVARALLGTPALLLADEPTAALGWEIGQVVVDLLIDQARRENCGLLIVTHDARLLPKFDRLYEIHQGQLNENKSPV